MKRIGEAILVVDVFERNDMFDKIDIYYSGQYVCSTNSSRTLKEAKEKFIKSPKWMGAFGIKSISDPYGIAPYAVVCKWADRS
jgi:hypothetical protein